MKINAVIESRDGGTLESENEDLDEGEDLDEQDEDAPAFGQSM